MEYLEQLFAYKFNNLDKMNQFLEKYKLPQLTHMKYFDSFITTKEIKFIV